MKPPSFENLSDARVAMVAAVLAFAAHFIQPVVRAVTKRRLEAKRMTLQAVREDADRLDGSFKRLEVENERVWEENTRLHSEIGTLRNKIDSLDTAIRLERDMHGSTRKRCERLERIARSHGWKGFDEEGS